MGFKTEFEEPLEEALSNLPYQERERFQEKLEEFEVAEALFGIGEKKAKNTLKKILRKNRGKKYEEIDDGGGTVYVDHLEKISKIRYRRFREFYNTLSKIFGFEKTQEILYKAIENYESKNPDDFNSGDIWRDYIEDIVSGKDR